MRNIIFLVIGIISCIVTIWENSQAYIKGEYDPNIIRLRQGYEWKLTMMLASAGLVLPAFFIKLPIIGYLYILIVFGTLLLSINILNVNTYKKTRKKGTLIYTIISDLFFIILIIYLSNLLFK